MQASVSTDPVTAGLATELIALFGDQAGAEAKARANRSRDLGNVVGYCRWRQAERFIASLASVNASHTIH